MNDKPLISVILCTYNNADSLAITLDHLTQCILNTKARIEILVIDNNSSDNTVDVVKKVEANTGGIIKYCVESKQGLSNARNLGLLLAKGEYLLFTDDDADIPTDWLELYKQKIIETHADCLYSRIEVQWDNAQPWWYDRRYNPYFVHLNYGDTPLKITDIHHEFFGKNFCCKKTTLEEMGGFDTRLGRNGTSLAAGEETIIYRRLISQGASVVYFPDAMVGHRLKPAEYTEKNIEKKFVDGAGSALMIANYFSERRILGRPIYPLAIALKNITKSILLIPFITLPLNQKNKRELFYRLLQMKRSVKLIKLWITT